tara:strand:- start:1250 stop:2059 length:810 start_codon:yes stop_codon:yes gene_type:complete
VKYAISNIALPQYKHYTELSELASLGFEGMEIAPSRVWSDTWKGLTAMDIQRYRHDVENAGLEVVGLHSLLFDQPDLALCDSTEKRALLMEYFVHLSGMCRDLGGRTIIWGGGRRRGEMPEDEALTVAVDFFGALADRIECHGTVYCLEPLAAADTDFVNSVRECQAIAHTVNRPGLKVQIDVKAMANNNELDQDTISAVAADLVHVHANEPGFEVLGSSGAVDHHLAGECLRGIGYDRYVSIEQKMIDPDDILGPIRQSYEVLRKAYA